MTQLEVAKRELLSHYISLCAVSDDWKKQAWRSANDLSKEYPAELGDLPQLLTQAMTERKSNASS